MWCRLCCQNMLGCLIDCSLACLLGIWPDWLVWLACLAGRASLVARFVGRLVCWLVGCLLAWFDALLVAQVVGLLGW